MPVPSDPSVPSWFRETEQKHLHLNIWNALQNGDIIEYMVFQFNHSIHYSNQFYKINNTAETKRCSCILYYILTTHHLPRLVNKLKRNFRFRFSDVSSVWNCAPEFKLFNVIGRRKAYILTVFSVLFVIYYLYSSRFLIIFKLTIVQYLI